MELYEFGATYVKDTKTSYRVLLNDTLKTLLVVLDIYCIDDIIYLDIRTDYKNLHMGQRINTYEDLFEICKRKYKEFPNVKLLALPINLNGFNFEFNIETAGILQDLRVVV